MANEFKHGSVGTQLTQAEWESTTGHVLDSQATGDIIYASSATQLRRLGIGSSGQVLKVSGGVPAWGTDTTNVAASALTGTTMAANVVASSLTSVGTLTALTVDNISINGTTIGHTGDTDLLTLASGALTVTGKAHIENGSAGSVTANSAANNLVIEDSDGAGITILTPDGNTSYYALGSASDGYGARVNWNFDSKIMSVGTANADGILTFASANYTERMRITAAGNIELLNNGLYDVGNANSEWTSSGITIGSGHLTLDGDGKWIYLKGGGVGTNSTGIAWTFSTADTRYMEIQMDYDLSLIHISEPTRRTPIA